MLESLLNQVLEWCSANPDWLVVFIGIVAFLESLAIVGIVMPGVVMLAGLAALAASADISIYSVLLGAFVGAVLGDGISYLIGRYYKLRIQFWWPFRKQPELISSGQGFFERHGGKSVVIGRFVGPVRPVIPLVAGLLSMPAQTFFLLNISSALLWSPFYMLPGYLGGHILGNPSDLPVLQSFVVLLTIFAIVLSMLWLIEKFSSRISRILKWLPVVLMIVIMTSFSYLVIGSESLNRLDRHVEHVLALIQEDWVRDLALMLTLLGDESFLYLSSITLIAFLLLHGGKKLALQLSLIGVCLSFATHGLKAYWAIARPDWVLSPPNSFAYPSGHSSGFTLYVLICSALLLSQKPTTKELRLAVFLCAGLSISFLAFSRIYLGVHWLSDVVGGIMLGGLFGALAWQCVTQEVRGAPTETRTGSQSAKAPSIYGFGLSWLVMAFIYIVWQFEASSFQYSLK